MSKRATQDPAGPVARVAAQVVLGLVLALGLPVRAQRVPVPVVLARLRPR